MRSKSKKILVVVVIASVIVATFAFGVFSGLLELGNLSGNPSWLDPGWEIYNKMGGMKFNDQILTSVNQFTSPKDLGSASWTVDVDDPSWGIPTIMVEMSAIRHCDFSGAETEYNVAAMTLPPVTRGNETYYLDLHIYTFTVILRTIADREVVDRGYFTAPLIKHETTWPYVAGTISGGQGGTEKGKIWYGGAYVKFVINPWRGGTYHDSPTGYSIKDAWAGIMDAQIIYKDQGTVKNQWGNIPTAEADAQPWIKAGLDNEARVNMFADDGTFGDKIPAINWDASVTPDTRPASTAVLYFPVELSAGAKTHANARFIVDDIYPIDVMIKYKVRVNVLQTHDFSLQGGRKVGELQWVEDYFGWSESFWTSFLHGLDPFAFLGPLEPLVWFLVTVGIVIVIIVILVAIFAPWVLPRLAGTARATAKAARGR